MVEERRRIDGTYVRYGFTTRMNTYRCFGGIVCLVWVDDGTSVKTTFSMKTYTGGRNPPELCTRTTLVTSLAVRLDET